MANTGSIAGLRKRPSARRQPVERRQHEDKVLLVLTLIIGAVVGLVVVLFILLTENLGSRLYPASGAAWRRVLIPQVIRFALPGIGNVWQLSLKDSALIAVTGLAELMRTSQVAAGSTHQYFTFYMVGGALYLILTSLSNRVFDRAEARIGRSFRGTLARH